MSFTKPLSRVRSKLRRLGQRSSKLHASTVDESAIEMDSPPGGDPSQSTQWFLDHYKNAAQETIEFLSEGGVSLEEHSVADIGCGQGFMDLGIVHKAKPARLVGFDINETSREVLAEEARAAGVDSSLPNELEFTQSEPERLPAPDDNFDVVITWSAFEHIANPLAVLKEIRRTIRPHGVLFIQLWPFYHSQHGLHLMHWYPEGFCQFLVGDDQIRDHLQSDTETDRAWTEMMINEYSTLNQITLDELQADMREAGFRVVKLDIRSDTTHMPEGVDDWPLSVVGISGVKLLAVPTEPRDRVLKSVKRRDT